MWLALRYSRAEIGKANYIKIPCHPWVHLLSKRREYFLRAICLPPKQVTVLHDNLHSVNWSLCWGGHCRRKAEGLRISHITSSHRVCVVASGHIALTERGAHWKAAYGIGVCHTGSEMGSRAQRQWLEICMGFFLTNRSLPLEISASSLTKVVKIAFQNSKLGVWMCMYGCVYRTYRVRQK